MENSWTETRKAYEVYRQTKRNCRNVWMEQEKSYRRLDKAFTRLLNAQVNVFKRIDDPSQPDKLRKAARRYQEAKQAYEALIGRLAESIKAFQEAEIAYTRVILKNAKDSGMKITEMASLFGLWNSRITAWLQSENQIDLVELYNKEFGDLDEKDSYEK